MTRDEEEGRGRGGGGGGGREGGGEREDNKIRANISYIPCNRSRRS